MVLIAIAVSHSITVKLFVHTDLFMVQHVIKINVKNIQIQHQVQ